MMRTKATPLRRGVLTLRKRVILVVESTVKIGSLVHEKANLYCRKIKCDDQRPVCGSCLKSGREAEVRKTTATLTFSDRHSSHNSAPGQETPLST